MNRYILLITLFIFSISKFTQAESKNFDITIKVEGIKNDYGILAYYYGDKKFVRDTLRFNEKSIAEIKGEKDIKPGVYLVVFPTNNSKYFEFIINETSFQIETDTSDFVSKMKSKNSIENKIFYEDQTYISNITKEINVLSEAYEKLDSSSAEKVDIKKQIIEKNKLIQNSRDEIIKNYGNTLYGKVLKILQDIEIPDDIDSSKVLSYYRNAYLNSIDLEHLLLKGKSKDLLIIIQLRQ
jgi:hypothetical protein